MSLEMYLDILIRSSFFLPYFLEFYLKALREKAIFSLTFFIGCENDAYKYNQLI